MIVQKGFSQEIECCNPGLNWALHAFSIFKSENSQMNSRFLTSVLLAAIALGPFGFRSQARLSASAKVSGESYPYQSQSFSGFIEDSINETKPARAKNFYAWFDQAYLEHPKVQLKGAATLEVALEMRCKELIATTDPSKHAALEFETGAWLHRLIKTTIPRFSLERGFEFTNTVRLGERQCLLQSVLIAGLLQRMGIDAGTVMVWRNEKAYTSNNGHAVTLVKGSSGRDWLVDASDPIPTMRHQGLFVFDANANAFRFVEPKFAANGLILEYRRVADGQILKTSRVRELSVNFLRSQFYYYRGERAPGGFMGAPTTKVGLEQSAKMLEMAQRLEPQNPLAVYVLGHVYRKLGRIDQARAQYLKGYALYQAQGFVPQGPTEAYQQWGRAP